MYSINSNSSSSDNILSNIKPRIRNDNDSNDLLHRIRNVKIPLDLEPFEFEPVLSEHEKDIKFLKCVKSNLKGDLTFNTYIINWFAVGEQMKQGNDITVYQKRFSKISEKFNVPMTTKPTFKSKFTQIENMIKALRIENKKRKRENECVQKEPLNKKSKLDVTFNEIENIDLTKIDFSEIDLDDIDFTGLTRPTA